MYIIVYKQNSSLQMNGVKAKVVPLSKDNFQKPETVVNFGRGLVVCCLLILIMACFGCHSSTFESVSKCIDSYLTHSALDLQQIP